MVESYLPLGRASAVAAKLPLSRLPEARAVPSIRSSSRQARARRDRETGGPCGIERRRAGETRYLAAHDHSPAGSDSSASRCLPQAFADRQPAQVEQIAGIKELRASCTTVFGAEVRPGADGILGTCSGLGTCGRCSCAAAAEVAAATSAGQRPGAASLSVSTALLRGAFGISVERRRPDRSSTSRSTAGGSPRCSGPVSPGLSADPPAQSLWMRHSLSVAHASPAAPRLARYERAAVFAAFRTERQPDSNARIGFLGARELL